MVSQTEAHVTAEIILISLGHHCPHDGIVFNHHPYDITTRFTMDANKAEYAISIFADPTNIKEMTKGRFLAHRITI